MVCNRRAIVTRTNITVQCTSFGRDALNIVTQMSKILKWGLHRRNISGLHIRVQRPIADPEDVGELGTHILMLNIFLPKLLTIAWYIFFYSWITSQIMKYICVLLSSNWPRVVIVALLISFRLCSVNAMDICATKFLISPLNLAIVLIIKALALEVQISFSLYFYEAESSMVLWFSVKIQLSPVLSVFT